MYWSEEPFKTKLNENISKDHLIYNFLEYSSHGILIMVYPLLVSGIFIEKIFFLETYVGY